MPRAHYNKKRQRQRGGKRNHGPPHKKRRLNTAQKPQLSQEEKKVKCLNIIKTLQETLQKECIDLMALPKFTEFDVGIQSFINSESKSHKPIIANLKHKYEDFIVSEIDESGNVVKIVKNKSIPDSCQSSQNNNNNINNNISQSISNVYQQLSELINKETAQNFIKWYKDSIKIKHNIEIDIDAIDTSDKKENENDNNNNNNNTDITNFIFAPNKDKQQRTTIHKLLRNVQYIETKTNDKSCIAAEIIKRKFAKRRWPKTRGTYLKFVLTKCGMDTSYCLSTINHNLHKNSTKTFSIAGTKDKHAITSQTVTAFHVTCDEMQNAVKNMNNVTVGNFEYVNQEMKLGCLKGNEFKIALRNINYCHNNNNNNNEQKEQKSEAIHEGELKDRLSILNNIGFINYFGMQRFGSSTVGTHFIGKAICANKLCLAIALLILPRSNESKEFAKQRNEFIETGDIGLFPYKLYTEKKCIYGLLDDDKNYQQAFMKLPRNIRTLYTHSYQSYIWNYCVSQRINKYGYKPVIGDVVRLKNKNNMDANKNNGQRRDINDDFEYVTADNIDNYDIFDVVFPLVAPLIMLPKLNDIIEFMNDLLGKDGLTLDSFNNLDQSMWGINTNYRNIVVKPMNIKGMVKKYTNDNELLMDVPFESDTCDNNTNSNNAEIQNEKEKIAWIVSFELQKSSYATMCIRQLLFIASDKLKR